MKPKLIILINPTSGYERFCQACLERNINLIRLYTFTTENAYLQLSAKYFIADKKLTLNLDEDIKTIKEFTKGYELLASIPAIEIDFAYAEKIAFCLSPMRSNDPNSSYLRYEKFEMNKVLGQAGLPHIPQIRISFLESIDKNLSLPLVVKPSFQSGGGVGVKICDSFEQVQAHLEILREFKDIYGNKLESDIIIQEKIEGVEYFADSVSWQGEHYITSIYRYEKDNIEGSPISRYADYISPQNDVWKQCYDYIQKVLTVLQVKFGFAHTEFMLTHDKRPFLMELNPRLSGGGGLPNFLLKVMGRDDASDVYLKLLNGKLATEIRDEEFKPQTAYGRILCLFAWKKMLFTGLNSAIFAKLQTSEHAFHSFKSEGAMLYPPKDLRDIVGAVTLVDKDLQTINADTEFLQQLERKGTLFNT